MEEGSSISITIPEPKFCCTYQQHTLIPLVGGIVGIVIVILVVIGLIIFLTVD